MKYILSGILCIVFSLLSLQVFAVNVYECEDAEGNRTFQKHCPPGTTAVQEKKLSTGKKESAASTASINATIYTVKDCGEACDEIIEFLKIRNASITEKNVGTSIELQNELKEVAGELRVPVTVIGDHIIKGYDRAQLLDAVKAAGYVEPETETTATASEPEPTTTNTEPAAEEPSE